MQDEPTERLGNPLLFRFIGLAYEATKGLSKGRLEGDAERFLAQLYLRRLSSVFGDQNQADHGEGTDLKEMLDRLGDMRARRGADLLVGHAGDFRMDVPPLERGGHDHRDRGGEGGPPRDWRDSRVEELGLEAYATYLPIHFFPEGAWPKMPWGIYISEEGVDLLAETLRRGYEHEFGPPNPQANATFRRVAFEVLLRHEMEHFKVESFALNAEMYRREAVYVPYLQQVYVRTFETDGCLEEALANATVLNSRVVKKLVYDLIYPAKPKDWWRIIAQVFFDHQPAGYTNYNLTRGWADGDTEKGGYSGPKTSDRRNAMNFLCNQIVTAQVHPAGEPLPFFAFLPDNYFLRADSLVPVYVVKSLEEDRSFINLQTPTKKEWERFLREIGFAPTEFGNGDHTVWKRDGFNPLTIDYYGKHLNLRSYKSSLRTLGIKISQFAAYHQTGKIPMPLASRLKTVEHQFSLG